MRRRARGPKAAATAALAVVALAGCTPASDDGPGAGPDGSATTGTTATSTAERVTIISGTRPEQQLLARAAARHLQNRGFAAVLGESSVVPWRSAGGGQVAVVDSLAMAAQVAPATLAGPVPTPTPSPRATSGTGSVSPSTGASAPARTTPAPSPSDPAPASPTAHPTATGSPTPLPEGVPAPDAAGTTAMVVEHLPAGAEIIGESAGTLRLQAVTTTAIGELYSMEELRDLNGLCGRMAFIPRDAGALEAQRLEVLAGCEPAQWLEPGQEGPAIDLVRGRADVAMLYGTDPAIPDHALQPLADSRRVLPEGRVLLVADPGSVPGGATGALAELAGRLGGEQLAELQRLTVGPDALPPEEAAQYWLVAVGLEPAPEGWF